MCELIIFFFFSLFACILSNNFRFAIYICHAIIFFACRHVIFPSLFFMHIHKHIHTRTYSLHIIFVSFFSSALSFFFFYLTFFVSLFFLSSYIFSLLPYYMVIIKCKYDVTFIVIFTTHLNSRF